MCRILGAQAHLDATLFFMAGAYTGVTACSGGMQMELYMITVGVLRVIVSFLLLLAASSLCCIEVKLLRLICASVTGGIYAVYCMFPDLYFPGNVVVYYLVLLLMGAIAFGKHSTALWATCVLVIENFLIDVLLRDAGSRLKVFFIILAIIVLLYLLYNRNRKAFVPVVLNHKGKSVSFMALRDTGNTLKDPVTGKPVLIVGADIAKQLLGIDKEQLKKPIDYIHAIPGLRLIPYRTIGQNGGLMLAIKLQNVRVGHRKGSEIIAFAPENIGQKGYYQALTGGYL